MRLKIFINEEFEDERALVNIENNEVLLKGDCYHDKIDEKIEGFLLGLDFANIEYVEEEDEWIDLDSKMFSIIGFCED